MTSDKAWCVVTKGVGKFTVSAASQPRAAVGSYEDATITVSVGSRTEATLTVSRTAELAKYPETIEALIAAISKTWIIESGSDYASLTIFEGRYSLEPRRASRAFTDSNPYPVLTSIFAVAMDLRTIQMNTPDMSRFGTLEITDLTADRMQAKLTVENAAPISLQLHVAASTMVQSPCRRLTNLTSSLDSGEKISMEFTWQNDRLVSAIVMDEPDRADYTVTYPAKDRMRIDMKSANWGGKGPCDVSAFLQLDPYGLARKVDMIDNKANKYLARVDLRYSVDGSLIFAIKTDDMRRRISSASLEWQAGNPVREYYQSRFPWDENGDGVPDLDFDGSGSIDAGDYIFFFYDTHDYTYDTTPNKGRFMLVFEMPEAYEFDNYGFGFLGYLTGALGVGSKSLLNGAVKQQYEYTLDAEGYPTKIIAKGTVSGKQSECNLSFSWQR